MCTVIAREKNSVKKKIVIAIKLCRNNNNKCVTIIALVLKRIRHSVLQIFF